MAQSDDDHWSCCSFAVSYRDTLNRLSVADRAVMLKAIVDRTPKLRTFLRRDYRDCLIRELAALYGGKPTPTAERIAQRLSRYLSGPWKLEREAGTADGASRERQLLYLIARAESGGSLSDRTIADIISKNEVCPGATS